MPQEFGLRTDSRWLEFSDRPRAKRCASTSCEPGSAALVGDHLTAADMFAARTLTDLRPHKELTAHLDVAHRGLGTASCGPDTLPQYRVQPGAYRFAYRL